MTQCFTAMRNKLEGLADYETWWEEDDDVVALLDKMKELVVYSTEEGTPNMSHGHNKL